MAQLLDSGIFSVIDTDSSIGVGWKLNVYASGTSARLDTYPTEADADAESNANANPVIIGADGRLPPMWVTAAAKGILTDENDVVKETIDPLPGSVSIGGAAGSVVLPQMGRLLAKLDNANEDAIIVVLGDSTGDETTEWPHLTGEAIAVEYPAWTVRYRLWGGSSYAAHSTIQTGSGSRILTIYNASVTGTTANYAAGDRFLTAVTAVSPDLVFVSYGHNGGVAAGQLAYFDGLAYSLNTRATDVPVVVIGQNPTLTGETMRAKVDLLRAYAARNSYGFIDVHAAFKQAGVALSTLLADSIHPNADGSELWAATVMAAFRASRIGGDGGTVQTPTLIRSWSTIAQFNDWTLGGTAAAVARNSTNYETLNHSTNLASVAGAAWYVITAIDSHDIISVRGKHITFAIRVRVPSGNVASSGRIDIEDNAATSSSSGVVQDGFVTFTCTHRVDESATFVKLYIYPTEVTATNTINVAWATLSLGLSPAPFLPAKQEFARTFDLIGSATGTLMRAFNGAGDTDHVAVGFSANSGTESDTVAQRVWSIGALGFGTKSRAAVNTQSILQQGSLRFGDGTTAPTIVMSASSTTRLTMTGGHFESGDNGTYTLGINGAAWGGVFIASGGFVKVANIQVVGAQGAAVADATDAASAITQLNALLARARAHGLIAT